MEYLINEQLSLYVGQILWFEGFGGKLECGILTKENQYYWLPFCGKVKATTVKINTNLLAT